MPLHLDAGVEPIAGYMLVRLLGRGGFGEVWEANAPGDVRVALKFIRLDTKKAGVEQRALEVIRNIRHPHLLDVQFATRVDDCLVIAMPLCDESLMQRLRACQAEGLPGVPRDELLVYMEDLARAVDFLNEPHAKAGGASRDGVQHRDIKPHNIFLVGGSVRLADFGLAKILAASSGSHTGSMSPHYVAPEVIAGRVSQRSDQYSLAVTYVQLRTGRLPFEGESAMQIIYAHVHNAPELSLLPEAERPVVARALAKRPEERWPSCQAFVRALVGAARNENGRQAAPGGSTHVPDAGAMPMTRGFTELPETQVPPPLPSTRIDDGSTSGVGAEKTGSRHHRLRHAGLLGLVALFAVLVAMIAIPRLSPSTDTNTNTNTDRTPSSSPPPLARTNLPVNRAEVRSPDAHLSRPGNQGGAVEVTENPAKKEPATSTAPGQTKNEPAPAKRTPELPEPRPAVPDEPPKLITNSIGMKLVLIPAGEFLMGSPDTDKDGEDDEKPQHRVRITRPFYLGVYEVTQQEYETVMGQNPSSFSVKGDGKDEVAGQDTRRHPVESLSRDKAIAFCNKLSEREGLKPYYQFGAGAQSGGDGYRLPTEAEWEYACRAGSATKYSFGDDAASLGEYAWYFANSETKTHPVGQKRPNAWGLYDMHGNVWEWCWDGYDAKYYAQSPVDDPRGLSGASDRVIRGGSGYHDPRLARSAERRWFTPDNRNIYLGFRLARAQSGQ